ncbi:hypothetical protein ANTRET_LOCUS8228 [Anthophora retusa]
MVTRNVVSTMFAGTMAEFKVEMIDGSVIGSSSSATGFANKNLVCCASDVLEGGRGVVRVAVTVSELLRFHQSRSPLQTSSTNVPNHVPA